MWFNRWIWLIALTIAFCCLFLHIAVVTQDRFPITKGAGPIIQQGGLSPAEKWQLIKSCIIIDRVADRVDWDGLRERYELYQLMIRNKHGKLSSQRRQVLDASRTQDGKLSSAQADSSNKRVTLASRQDGNEPASAPPSEDLFGLFVSGLTDDETSARPSRSASPSDPDTLLSESSPTISDAPSSPTVAIVPSMLSPGDVNPTASVALTSSDAPSSPTTSAQPSGTSSSLVFSTLPSTLIIGDRIPTVSVSPTLSASPSSPTFSALPTTLMLGSVITTASESPTTLGIQSSPTMSAQPSNTISSPTTLPSTLLLGNPIPTVSDSPTKSGEEASPTTSPQPNGVTIQEDDDDTLPTPSFPMNLSVVPSSIDTALAPSFSGSPTTDSPPQEDDSIGLDDDFTTEDDTITGNDDFPQQGDDVIGEDDDLPPLEDDATQNDDFPPQGDDVVGVDDDLPPKEDDFPSQGDDIAGVDDDLVLETEPSEAPIFPETSKPSSAPSMEEPTTAPTENPTGTPNIEPTDRPSLEEASPTSLPTKNPARETQTDRPTSFTTENPTLEPAPERTDSPTSFTTEKPAREQAPERTDSPTSFTTENPTREPAPEQTDRPTRQPATTPEASDRPNPRPTREPSSSPQPTGGSVLIRDYQYSRGNCPDPGSTGLPCSPDNLARVCSKRDGGSFTECLRICEPSFCCIHDAPAETNSIATSCAQDENCAQYAPCYIVWWKIHDTVGPAPFLRLDQEDDFFDAEKLQDATTDRDFYGQWAYHHWDDTDSLLYDVLDNKDNLQSLFSNPEIWEPEDGA